MDVRHGGWVARFTCPAVGVSARSRVRGLTRLTVHAAPATVPPVHARTPERKPTLSHTLPIPAGPVRHRHGHPRGQANDTPTCPHYANWLRVLRQPPTPDTRFCHISGPQKGMPRGRLLDPTLYLSPTCWDLGCRGCPPWSKYTLSFKVARTDYPTDRPVFDPPGACPQTTPAPGAVRPIRPLSASRLPPRPLPSGAPMAPS